MNQQKIAFIGAGNMASAIIGGLIQSGVKSENISAADPYLPSLQSLHERFGIAITQDNNAVIAQADIVVLAVKPQQAKEVCLNLANAFNQQRPLLISIAAGISSTLLAQWLGARAAIVRCMPNTPALVGKAASGVFANTHVSEQQHAAAQHLLAAIGTVDWVADEALLDAVTALSGSGPAYFFLVMEAMIAAGVQLGLSAEAAKNLTLQTALGAASMAMDSDVEVDELRRRVTSPNGTTQAAIESFEANDIRGLFMQALAAANLRSQTLAKEAE